MPWLAVLTIGRLTFKQMTSRLSFSFASKIAIKSGLLEPDGYHHGQRATSGLHEEAV